jgi:hypothetical protein
MDLNHRPPGPEPGALARLRYAPTNELGRTLPKREYQINIAPLWLLGRAAHGCLEPLPTVKLLGNLEYDLVPSKRERPRPFGERGLSFLYSVSVIELQRELYQPRPARLADLAERCAEPLGIWIQELYMVEGIEEFRPELERL